MPIHKAVDIKINEMHFHCHCHIHKSNIKLFPLATMLYFGSK